MFQRLKRLVQLSKKDPEALRVLESLSPEQMNAIPDEGDGKAIFFSEGTNHDFEEQKREDTGMKPWHDLLKNL